jgi:superfamily I DNA/RNA helicase
MLDFYDIYPDTNFIVLENNYRSAQSVLDLATTLIENNSERLVNRLDFLEKKLISQTEYKTLDKNKYLIFANDIAEKMYVADDIKKN